MSLRSAGAGDVKLVAADDCSSVPFPEGVALITDSRATWKTPQFPHYEIA
jgi:hypothetical protein